MSRRATKPAGPDLFADPGKRAVLERWADAACARFFELRTMAGFWRFVDSVVEPRIALKKEAPDLDAKVGSAAREAYERINGGPLV